MGAKLRTVMDAAFWDLKIATPENLDGFAMEVPGEIVPLDADRASKVYRFQQLSSLRHGFPLGLIPAYSAPRTQKDLGPLTLHSFLGQLKLGPWWYGLVGQVRPKKLISSVKAEVNAAKKWDLSLLKDAGKHFQDKSLYAVGQCLEIGLTCLTALQLSRETHYESKRTTRKARLYHDFRSHDVTLEAAWPQLFVDNKGKYWEVPETVSLDLMSIKSKLGFRYRFGIQKIRGHAVAVDSVNREAEAPPALLPGVCAKAAFSFEKSKDFWREIEMEKDVYFKTEDGKIAWFPAYDLRLREAHEAISGIVGVNCEKWLDGVNNAPNRDRFGVDFFGSVCYTRQHGTFRQPFNDLTRVDARLEIGSTKNMFGLSKSGPVSPRLNLIFQQQIVGPVVFRVDTKHSLKSVKPEDVIYSLNCSLKALDCGKVVAWYSPKRKEGMIELRYFD